MEAEMLKEFREFALKGNVVDLAVGVIIGAAFGKIVDSMVNDIIMPIIGAVTGGLDFSNMYWMLTGTAPASAGLADARKAGAVFAYGNFITVVVNFAIIAFVLFLVIKAMNQLKRLQEAAVEAKPTPAPTPPDVKLLTEIRDILATGSPR
jgi:large conductance mechanosensitive channel